MHAAMWAHPATRERVATLARARRAIRRPGGGAARLGRGRHGPHGRGARDRGARSRASSAPAISPGRTVLVTAGPTHEAIDPVRYLANRSSGKMGFAIAAEAARRGARSTLLVAGPVALATPAGRGARRRRVGARDGGRGAPARAGQRPRGHGGGGRRLPPRARGVQPRSSGGAGVPSCAWSRIPTSSPASGAGAAGAARRLRRRDRRPRARGAPQAREQKGAHLLVANDVAASDIGFAADDNEVTVYRRGGEPLFLSRRSEGRAGPRARRPLRARARASGREPDPRRSLTRQLPGATSASTRSTEARRERGARPNRTGARRVRDDGEPPSGSDGPAGEPGAAEALFARLAAEVAECRRCRLCEGRNRTVFGDGDPHARLMFIGEGPGAEEDRTGLPFVGRAGELLTRIIQAIGICAASRSTSPTSSSAGRRATASRSRTRSRPVAATSRRRSTPSARL